MKTKEEVLEHMNKVGYTKNAVSKIVGFLVGVGLAEMGDRIPNKKGDKEFSDFYSWYQYDDSEVLKSIIDDIIQRLNNAKSDIEASKYNRQLNFMFSEFDS